MEAKGTVECLRTPVEQYSLRYTEYLGDGDSKGNKAVVESDPYNGINISKLECIGHIQKRVRRKLRNLKDGAFKDLYEDDEDEWKFEKDSEKIRFTDKMINKLQNYYGIAVRASTGRTAEEMKRYWCSSISLLWIPLRKSTPYILP